MVCFKLRPLQSRPWLDPLRPICDPFSKKFKKKYLRARRNRDRKNKWPFSEEFSLFVKFLDRKYRKIKNYFVKVEFKIVRRWFLLQNFRKNMLKNIKNFACGANHFHHHTYILWCAKNGPSEARPTLKRTYFSRIGRQR